MLGGWTRGVWKIDADDQSLQRAYVKRNWVTQQFLACGERRGRIPTEGKDL